MVSGKTIVAVAVVAVVILVATSVVDLNPFVNYFLDKNPFSEHPVTYKAILSVNGYADEESQAGNESTSSTERAYTISYSVSNLGNATAQNVTLNVVLDGELHTTNVIPSLSVSETMNYSLVIKTKRDSLHILSLQASCEDSTDSQSFPLDANFPRTFSEKPDIITLFITPKDPSVINLKDSIMKNKLPGISAWVALRDWVGKNIKYEHDSQIHGVADYWQFAKETISSRTGDCEDHAILLVSLLRASGYSQNDVYVVVGKNANGYHAWVRINLGVIGWYNLEPQESGWATIVGDFLTLSGYQAAYQFNDYYFQKVTQ